MPAIDACGSIPSIRAHAMQPVHSDRLSTHGKDAGRLAAFFAHPVPRGQERPGEVVGDIIGQALRVRIEVMAEQFGQVRVSVTALLCIPDQAGRQLRAPRSSCSCWGRSPRG